MTGTAVSDGTGRSLERTVGLWSVVAWAVAWINIAIAAPYEYIVKGPWDSTGFPAIMIEAVLLCVWPWFYYFLIYRWATQPSPGLLKGLRFMIGTHFFALFVVICDMPIQVKNDMTRAIVYEKSFLRVLGYADVIVNAYLTVCIGVLAYWALKYHRKLISDVKC